MQSHSRLANAVPAAMTKTVSGVRLAALLSLVMLAAPPSVALARASPLRRRQRPSLRYLWMPRNRGWIPGWT